MPTRLVVEWTRTSLRVAAAEGRGATCRLSAVRRVPLGTPEETAQSLRSLVAQAKSAQAVVVGVIPREAVITRVVKFPSSDPAELAQMVELYAKAQLPYPGGQAVTDFHVVSQGEAFTTVAVVACQRDGVDRPLAALREAGLAPVAVTVSSWGVLEWYRQMQALPGAFEAPGGSVEEPCLIVHIDEARTDLVLVGDGRLLSSRSLGQGAEDWRALEDPTELLALEIERSRAAIRKELVDRDARTVLLTGLGPLAQWREWLARRLDLPIGMADPRRPFAGAVLAQDCSPVVAGGLACGRLHGLLNLSPLELRAQIRHRRQVRELATVGILLFAVLALGSAALGVAMWREHRLAARLDQLVAELEPPAKRLQAQGRSASAVSATLEERRRLAATLAGVFSATPPVVALEAVAVERGRRETTVRGIADSTQTVLDYVQQLGRLDGVAAVELRYATRRASAAGERVDFELILRAAAGGADAG